MSNFIDSLQLSGTNYSLKDPNATNVTSVTQAEYDALVTGGTLDPTVMYIISDAQPIDISQFWTSAQTNSAINEAVSGKLDTSVFQTYSGDVDTALANKVETSAITTSVTTASTDSEIPTAKAVNDAIAAGGGGGGGSVTVDPSLDSGSTNPVANSAITNAFNTYTALEDSERGIVRYWSWITPNYPYGNVFLSNFAINGRCPLSQQNGVNSYIWQFSLVETSAITTSMSSSSTDAQVPSAKAVYDQLGGMKIVKLTESEYAALVTKDPDVLYVVIPDPSN